MFAHGGEPKPIVTRRWVDPARVVVMGVLNVTPDSFFDGGAHATVESAVARAHELVRQGADVIDVGGESTRPGSDPVSQDEERARVMPVIDRLAGDLAVSLSIDTRRAAIADEALSRGVSMVNAVASLRDPDLARVCAKHGAALVLNHMRGDPRTMQQQPRYEDVVVEVADDLVRDACRAEQAGVARDRIWLDPGIGFGKHPIEHNLPLLARLGELVALGYPVLVGPSRKSFLGALTGAAPQDRLPGTLAVVAACVLAGARGVRVHDVAEARQAVDVAAAIRDAGTRGRARP